MAFNIAFPDFNAPGRSAAPTFLLMDPFLSLFPTLSRSTDEVIDETSFEVFAVVC